MRRSLLTELEEHPFRILVSFRLPLIFIAFYAIDLAVYIFIIKSAYPTFFQGFLTSPFSPTEDYTGHYPSPQVGAVYNLGLVTFIILFADIYFRLIRPSQRRVSPATTGFFIAVAASYLLSGIWWIFTGAPSAGTSIIGSSMLLTLIVFSGRDFLREAKKKSRLNDEGGMPWGTIVYISVSLVVYIAEYIISSSLLPHLIGDAMFGALMVLFLRPRGWGLVPSKSDDVINGRFRRVTAVADR